MGYLKTKKNQNIKKGFLTGFPFLVFFIAIFLISVWSVDTFISKIPLFFYGNFDSESEVDVRENTGDNFYIPVDFPLIHYNDNYAKLSIPSLNVKNVPVFCGDNQQNLSKGIGHFYGSRFPGQNGNIVYSGHVTTPFSKLEKIAVGDEIIVDTSYGEYKYEVTGMEVYSAQTTSYIHPTDGEERLTIYTCYPYQNNFNPRVKRFVVVCKKTSGKNWTISLNE